MEVELLTGRPIRPPCACFYLRCRGFQHALWVKKCDLDLCISREIGGFKRAQLMANAEAVTVPTAWGPVAYYNISQIKNGECLFDFYLRRRHFLVSYARPFGFKQMCSLEDYAEAFGFRENIWISKAYLWSILGNEFYVLPDSKHFKIPYFHDPLYNIQQTNDPELLKIRILNISRYVLSSKRIGHPKQKALFEYQMQNSFRSSLWLTESDLSKISIPLKPGSVGLRLDNKIFFNTEELCDPLGAEKIFENERAFTRCNLNILNKSPLPPEYCNLLLSLRATNKFYSKFWIQNSDMKLLGAICKANQRSSAISIDNSFWYNLGQMENPCDIIQSAYRLFGTSNKRRALETLDELLDSHESQYSYDQ